MFSNGYTKMPKTHRPYTHVINLETMTLVGSDPRMELMPISEAFRLCK